MKTMHFVKLVSLGVLVTACGAANEDVGSSPDDTATDDIVTDGLREIASSLGLKNGASKPEARAMGDCYRALVTARPGGPYRTKEFENGAIVTSMMRGAGAPMICVDVHEKSISFSGVALDAIARYGLGKLVDVQRVDPASTKVIFSNGSMAFSNQSQEDRVKSLMARPSDLAVGEGGPSITGSLASLTLKDVEVGTLYAPPRREELTIAGNTAWVTFLHVRQTEEKSNHASPENDAVGTFAKKAMIFGDAGGTGEKLTFAKVHVSHYEVHNMSSIDPRLTEDILVGPKYDSNEAQPTPFIACKRDYPEDAKKPPFTCTGVR
jgi:hypothetical protein